MRCATLFPAWIEYLPGSDRTGELRRLQNAFVQEVCPGGDALEERLAQKFGLLAAAGQLALEAGLLEWPSSRTTSMLRRAYDRHRSTITTPSDRAWAILRQLAKDSANHDRFLPPEPKQDAQFKGDTVGIRIRHSGVEVLGFPDVTLRGMLSDKATRHAFDALLLEHQLLRGGDGTRRTTQLRHAPERDGKRFEKPRYLLIGLEALKRCVMS